MPHDLEFKNCDAATVFAEVSSSIEFEVTQSLWDRLLQEMGEHRVDGAVSYLVTEFRRLAAILDRELTRLELEQ